MKSHVCWVCMIGFKRAIELEEHESRRGHVELVFRQAIGKDVGPAAEERNEKRRLLSGIGNEISEEPWTESDEEKQSGDLSFCRCVLGWRIGACEECIEAQIDEDKLRERIFLNMTQVDFTRQETMQRKQSLRKGLQHFLKDDSDYDPRKAAKKIEQYKTPLMKLQDKLEHVRTKLFMPDELKRARSPLMPSKTRRHALSKVFFLGCEISTPETLAGQIQIPKQVELLREKVSKLTKAISSEDEVRRGSPLVSSHERWLRESRTTKYTKKIRNRLERKQKV